jgi:serine/threonine protein kinase
MERGLITREQLEECLREQKTEAAVSGRPPRSVGVFLVAKGYLTDAQLVGLLDEQKARLQKAGLPAAAASPRQEDVLLGKLLVKHGLTTQAQLNECLRQQSEAETKGAPVRLGELLVQKGYATKEGIARVLALQQKTILACPMCGMKYNVAGYGEGREVRCKKCNEPLVPPASLDTVHVDGSAPAMQPVAAGDLPADVAAAAKNPLSHFGKYILVKELGRGGMGVVYKAWQTDLRRVVALKLLSSRSTSSVGINPSATDDEVKRFYREAQTAAKLKHPNIVSIFEVGQHNAHYFLTMEFIEGATLERWVRSGKLKAEAEAGPRASRAGALPRRAAEVVRDVALAVQAAHDQNIIHRDLKPQNILMDPDGRPHVTDFGLAKSMTANRKDAATLTVSGIILGTPAYMSPEQASGGKIKLDARSDVYSLGAILYECLVGRPPFGGNSSLDIVMQVLKTDPPPPSAASRQPVPRELETICLKAMEKDRERRYPTAKALAEDLDRWLQGESIVARPQSTWYRLQKKVRSNPVLASALAAAAVALIAVSAIALSGDGGAGQRRRRIEEALRDGKALFDKGQYEQALVHYDQALKLDPAHEEAAKGRDAVAAALRRAEQIERQKQEEERRKLEEAQKQREEAERRMAELQKQLEDLASKAAQATTAEEKQKLDRQREEAAKQIAALSGKPVAAPSPPPQVPPSPVQPPPPVPPPVAAPADGLPPPSPLRGDGPKLLTARRYGEMHDRLRRDRNAFGPLTDYQVAWIRSGAELWEAFLLGKDRLRERKTRPNLPVLASATDFTDVAVGAVDVAKGSIDLEVTMRTGGTGIISQSIPELTPAHFVDLVRLCVKDNDPAMHERFGHVHALHGNHDEALACLARAKQFGGDVDASMEAVVAAAAAPPGGKPEVKALAEHLKAQESLLEKRGKDLPDAARGRLERAAADVRRALGVLEAEDLLRQAEAAAQKRDYKAAFDAIGRLLAAHPDAPSAARARELADSLPHPDGKLLCGFEAESDIKGWGKSPNASVDWVGAAGAAKEGTGALKLTLTGQVKVTGGQISSRGSFIGYKLVDIPFDRVRSINFWVRGEGNATGPVLFGCYTSQTSYYFTEFRVDRTWKQVRLVPARFEKEGAPDWKRIAFLGFSFFENGTLEFMLDSVRLQE